MPESTRKFYRTLIEIEVLSEDKVDFADMAIKDIDYAITYGDCSGKQTVKLTEEIGGKQMAERLTAQASDPGFFGLTDDGEDVTGEDEV